MGRAKKGPNFAKMKKMITSKAIKQIAKDPRFERLPCIHKGNYADDRIVERVTKPSLPSSHEVLHPCITTMASKLLSRLRSHNLQITPNHGRQLLLNATRLFSHQPISTVASQSAQPRDNSNGTTDNKAKTASSLKDDELVKFSAISNTWWDSEGPFKPLHSVNPIRLAFIRSALCRHFGKDPNYARPFEGLEIVDVGCGGGMVSEPLARMGATVTGVDAVENNINVARLHADLDPATSTIEYCCTTAEKLLEEQRKFDVVISLEVIEHVGNPAEFCKSLAALTYPGGATIVSTINRSMRAYASAIVAAEYLLHWVPKGTHQWSSLITPEELVLILQRASINVKEMAGFVYNPMTGRFSLSDDLSVNYIAFGTKNSR